MNKNIKRFLQTLSIVLSLALLIGMTPAIAFAETVEHTTAVSSSSVVETSAEATALYEDTSRREENVKHYRMSDGTYTAISYSQPVHYLDAGTYREIDNTLYTTQVGGKSVLRNRSNAFTAAFPSSMSSADEISMTHGNHQIFWKIGTGTGNNLSTMSAVLENRVGTAAATETATLTANTSAAMENISMSGVTVAGKTAEELPGLALSYGKVSYMANPRTVYEYTVTGNKVKESIILASAPSETAYTFTFRTPGLTAQLQEDGSVVLSDGEEVFVIEAPYMQDAQGALSTDIEVTLQTTANGFVYTITPDAAWLNATDRAYPVVIDPTIGVPLTTQNAHSATYSTTTIDTSIIQGQYVTLGNAVGGSLKAMYHFAIPSTIPVNAQISHAAIYLTRADLGPAAVDVYAHLLTDVPLTDVWWNNLQNHVYYQDTTTTERIYDDVILDYGYITPAVILNDDETMLPLVGLDITRAAQAWHTGLAENNGILLSVDDYAPVNNIIRLASHTATDSSQPYFVYAYYDSTGTESYWSYAGADIGSSGTAYVNMATGMLHLDFPLLGTSSELLAAGVSLAYNINNNGSLSVSNAGKGMQLNYDARIETVTDLDIIDNYPYKYIDSDGTELYLIWSSANASSGEVTYKDEYGYDYTFVRNSTGWTMTDHTGNRMLFNSSGYLKSVHPSGTLGSINITRDSSNRVTSVRDGGLDTLTLTRNTSGMLTAVSDAYGRTVSLTYDASSNLIKITHYDGRTTLLTYSNNRPTQVIGADGRGVNIAYCTEGYATSRVRSLTECSRASSSGTRTSGNSLTFEYTPGNSTAVTDSRGIRTVTAFDDWGRCISRYNDFGAATVSYEGGTTDTNNIFRVSETASVSTPVSNLLTNHSFENGTTGWTADITGNYVAVSTAHTLMGNHALRLMGSDALTTVSQTVTVEPGETYTFSVYYRNSGFLDGGFAGISILVNGSWRDQDIDWDNTPGWERLQLTVTTPDTETATITVRLHAMGSGQAHFDCAQLEKSNSANAYNMVSNGMFEDLSSWNVTGAYTGSVVETTLPDDTPLFLSGAYKLTGRRGYESKISQDVAIGQSADGFALDVAGYAKAFAVPLQNYVYDANEATWYWADKNESNVSAKFEMVVTLFYDDGDDTTTDGSEIFHIPFNADTTAWQYVTKPIVPHWRYQLAPNMEVATARVELVYDSQANYVDFSGIGLYVNQNGMRYSYDDKGNLTGVVPLYSADAVATAYNGNNLVNTSESDTSGNWTYTYNDLLPYQLDSVKQEELDITIKYGYNTVGQLINTELSSDNYTAVIASSTTYSSNYRRVMSTTSETGTVTSYTYDSKGRLSTVSSGSAQSSYTYQDGTDRLLSATAKINNSKNATVSYTYDTYGQLTGVTGDSMAYGFTYNDFGQRTRVTAGGSTLSSQSYEPNNGLLKYSYDNAGNQTAYTYDEQDRLLYQTYTWNTGFNSMRQFAIEYTDGGNIHKIIDNMSGRTWRYHYDITGKLTRLTNNKGFGINYTYDQYNRVVGQRFRFGTSYSTNDYYNVSYTYNDLSIPMSTSFGNATKTRTLDALGRTSSTTLTASGGANWVTSYEYLSPAAGKTTTVPSTITINGLQEYFTYTYDANGNITSVKQWRMGETPSIISANYYTYDGIGQMTAENGTVYSYDTKGNILAKIQGNGTTTTYTYRTTGWTDQLISYNGQSITYDSNGNALTWRDGLAFTWSNSKQLATVSKNGTSVASYTYDAFGTRATKIVNGVTTTFYYVDDVLYMQDDGTNRVWYYYDADGVRVAMEYNNIMSYYIYNLQGDVIGLYDSTGTVIARYTYDAWGNPLTITGSNGADISGIPQHLANLNPFRYRGYFYDTESGLYYLNSRYYDPVVGRFLSADVQLNMDAAVGTNTYAYCYNNPICLQDSLGNRPIDALSVNEETSKQRSDACDIMKEMAYETAAARAKEIREYHINNMPPTSEMPEELKKLMGMVAGEAAGTRNEMEFRACAHVAMNRLGKHEWKGLSLSEILNPRDFHAVGGKQYNKMMTYLETGYIESNVDKKWFDKIVETVYLVYVGADIDLTDGAVFFSPNRKWYCGEEVAIPGTHHRFFRHPDDWRDR